MITRHRVGYNHIRVELQCVMFGRQKFTKDIHFSGEGESKGRIFPKVPVFSTNLDEFGQDWSM